MMALLSLLLSLGILQVDAKPSVGDQPTGTCEIHGRITDRETGRPIPRAIVQLRKIEREREWTSDLERTSRADDEGRYAFAGLPAGQYYGFVVPGDNRHLRGNLRIAGRRWPITLKEGEILKDFNVTLQRSLAVTVHVVDESGEPLSDLEVTVKSVDSGSEELSRSLHTDDRGRVRAYGLEPGRYIICADSGPVESAVAIDSPRRERFLRTCHASAATDADAEPIRIERADVDNVEIRMRRGLTFKIQGLVFDASGIPAVSAAVALSEFTRSGPPFQFVTVGAGGRFTVTGVAPGEYVLEGFLGDSGPAEQRRDLEGAYQPVRVDSADLENVTLTLSKAVVVTGRIILDDRSAFRNLPGTGLLFLSARLTDDTSGIRTCTTGPDDAGVFSFDRMFGRRTIDVGSVPSGYYVKAIQYGDKDVTDVPTEFKASTDPAELSVILSTRGALVTGRVLDDTGEPVRAARVLIFPADPSRWVGYYTPNDVDSATGMFRTEPQRPGDYFLAAFGPDTPLPQARERFAHLAETAERITLVGEEERTLDLRVLRPR